MSRINSAAFTSYIRRHGYRTKTELAEAVGLSGSQLSQRLTGRTPAKYCEVVLIANALRVTVNDLAPYFNHTTDKTKKIPLRGRTAEGRQISKETL